MKLSLKWKSGFIVLIVVLLLSGCGKMERDTETKPGPTQSEGEQAPVDFGNGGKGNNGEVGEYQLIQNKIIKSAYMEIESLFFEDTVHAIKERIMTVGGYIESANVTGTRITYRGNKQNRHAHFRLRIPKESFESFKMSFGELGNVINEREDAQDISMQYIDTEARVKSLEIQQERLLTIMEKATKIEDIIELEKALADVRYEIEKLKGNLKKWDNLVDFSTLEIEVYEVQEIKETKQTPISLWDKMKNGFIASIDALVGMLKGLMVVLAVLLPFVIIMIPIILIIIYLSRRIRKKDRSNR